MKAVLFEAFGASDTLRVAEVPKPAAGKGEALIRIEHTAVNPVDWKIREGYLKDMMPHVFPIIPGWDVSGVIEALGEGVEGFEVGAPVYAYARKPVVQGGTYAEYITLDANVLALRPTSLTSAQAASIPLAALTAWQALNDVAQLKRGERVLVTAGAGGVGSFAVQFAKLAGAEVATTASEGNHEYVLGLGADHAVDYRAADALDRLREHAPSGYDVVFDAAGGSALEQGFEVIKRGGRLVSIVETPDADRAAASGIQSAFHFVEPSGEQLKTIADHIDASRVNVPALEVRNVKQAAAALDDSQKGHTRGKIVLAVDFEA